MSSPSTFPSSASPSMSPIFSLTTAGYILPAITGILSCVCSITIVNVIRKSPQKLSTTYHRIMAFMSIFDIIASISIALTTLPMPSDDIVRFAGPMLGNKVTCQLQGFFIIFGISGGGSLYLCLSWYFVCRMTLNMKSETISRRIEPWFFIYSFFLALYAPFTSLIDNLINTGPVNPFCILSPDHSDCEYSVDVYYYGCDNRTTVIMYRDFSNVQYALEVFKYYTVFNVTMIIIAMVIIIWTILKKNRNIRSLLKDQISRNNNSNNNNIVSDDEYDAQITDLKYSRMLVVQALMYIFAYFVTWVFLIIPLVADIKHRGAFNIMQVLKSIFFPTQGVWNLIIFVYDKSYLVCHGDNYAGCWKIIKIVLFRPSYSTGIILPDSFRNTSNENEVLSHEVNRLDDMHHAPDEGSPASLTTPSIQNDKASEASSFSSTPSNSGGVINRDEFLRSDNENHKFYQHQYGIRRPGRPDNHRKDRTTVNSSASVESPVGFFGDSVVSGSGSLGADHYFLDDIQEEEEEDQI